MNGQPLPHAPTKKPASSNSSASADPTMPSASPRKRRSVTAWLLLSLALNVTACATPSTPSSNPPANPTMPQPATSQPSEPYSTAAQRNISEWRKKLQDTLGIR